MNLLQLIRKRLIVASVAVCAMAVIFATGWGLGRSDKLVVLISDAEAAGGVVPGPNNTAPDRYIYYPGTEILAEDEIRVVTRDLDWSESAFEARIILVYALDQR